MVDEKSDEILELKSLKSLTDILDNEIMSIPIIHKPARERWWTAFRKIRVINMIMDIIKDV